MADPDAEAQRHALMFGLFPDLFVQEPLRDMGCQLMAVRMADQMQQQVDGRRPAGAGDNAAVDFEQLVGDIQMREVFLEPVHMLPVDRAAPVLKQSGVSQQVGCGRDGPQDRSHAGDLAQIPDGARVAVALGPRTTDTEQVVELCFSRDGTVRLNQNAV